LATGFNTPLQNRIHTLIEQQGGRKLNEKLVGIYKAIASYGWRSCVCYCQTMLLSVELKAACQDNPGQEDEKNA